MIPLLFWLVVSTPLKNMKFSWDDDIPNIWKNKIHAPNHQSDYYDTITIFPCLFRLKKKKTSVDLSHQPARD